MGRGKGGAGRRCPAGKQGGGARTPLPIHGFVPGVTDRGSCPRGSGTSSVKGNGARSNEPRPTAMEASRNLLRRRPQHRPPPGPGRPRLPPAQECAGFFLMGRGAQGAPDTPGPSQGGRRRRRSATKRGALAPPRTQPAPNAKRGRCRHRPRLRFRPGSLDPGRFPIEFRGSKLQHPPIRDVRSKLRTIPPDFHEASPASIRSDVFPANRATILDVFPASR